MRATVMRDGKLTVKEVPDPVAGPGNVLVETIACGICGSDLHALKHLDRMIEVSDAMGIPADVAGDVGHGPRVLRPCPGARARRLGPGGRRHRRLDSAGHVLRRDGPGRVLPGISRRLRRAHGPDPGLLREGPGRRRPAASSPDRTDGRRRSRRRQGQDPEKRRRDRPRLRADRAGHHRRTQAHRRRADRRCRLLAETPGVSPRTMGAHVVVDPREEPAIDAWTRSAAGAHPRDLRGRRRPRHAGPGHALRPAQQPHHRRRRLHGARHDLADHRHHQGAGRSASSSDTTPWSSAPRCSTSPTATSTSRR